MRDRIFSRIALRRISILCLVDHQIDLGQGEAGQFDIKVKIDKRLELNREDIPVPARIERQLLSART
jgi:hypothetical protein